MHLQQDMKLHAFVCDAQNVHLKQDVISLRKKLQDAVETNDDQVNRLTSSATVHKHNIYMYIYRCVRVCVHLVSQGQIVTGTQM